MGKALRCCALVAGMSCSSFAAITFEPNNILVTDYSSGIVREYTPTGTLVQSIPVPYPAGVRPTSERPRDLAITADNKLVVYNGTFDPYLSVLNLATSTWQHYTFPGWSTGNNGRFGGIGSYGPFVFVSDSRTFGDGGLDEARGAIRFDLRDGSAVRFETAIGTHSVSVGLDGKVYALGNGDDSTRSLKVFDPVSLQVLADYQMPGDTRSPNDLAVDAAGLIYVSTNSTAVNIYAQSGGSLTFVESKPVGTDSRDFDLAPDGRVVFGTFITGVKRTDVTFSSIQQLVPGQDNYVAFTIAVPEPGSALLLAAGMAVLLGESGTGARSGRGRERLRRAKR